MTNPELAKERFFAGLRALDGGDLALAETNLVEALRLAPNRPSILSNLSIVCARQERLEEALAFSDAAIAQDSKEALYWLQKGSVQLKLAKHQDALSSLDAALERNSSIAEIHNNRGGALKELQRLDDALASYDKAISLKPDYAEAYRNRGTVLKDLGRLDHALASYDKAISLNPDFAEAHRSRGAVLKDIGRLDDALASLDKAITLKPDYAEAYTSRGNVLKDLGLLDEALASFDKAISLKPDLALAWIGVANVASERGQFEEAEEKYKQARLLDPGAVAPLCGIAQVKKFEDGDPLIPELRELLSQESLSEEDRARLHHAYAKICNDLGRHDDALQNYTMGKRLMSSKFSIEQHGQGLATMKRLFTRAFFEERAEYGVSDERPVFIVGMPRSGTTLTEQILSSHHLVDGLGELKEIPNIARKWCGGLKDSVQFSNSVARLTEADVKTMADSYLKAYGRSRKGSVRLIDKRPHNFEWLGLIALMFPNAHIIHCRRDPLDNCVSMYMQNFNENHGYNQDFSVLGQYYNQYVDLMDHWSEVLPLPVYNSVYEETVRDLEASARSLVSFLGLEWDPNCLEYHQQDRQVSTPSRWQVRQPLYDKSVGRWRLYEKHLDPLRKALSIN